MWFSIENMPYISLGWIGLGFLFLIAGIFILAHYQSKYEEYTQYDDGKELFSFFLEEEEKRNEAFRESIKNEYKEAKEVQPREQSKDKQAEATLYDEIIRLYRDDIPLEEIAKQMKVGIGEVKLIISLYSMR